MGEDYFASLVVLFGAALQEALKAGSASGSDVPNPHALGPGADTQAMARDLALELKARGNANAQGIVAAMCVPCGPYLETTLARRYLCGEISAAELVQVDTDALTAASRSPRRIGMGRIYELLIKNGMDPARAGHIARAAEVSIYNQVIHISQYVLCTMRMWDNPEFVALYSSRLATISINLDPDSSICREYGTGLFRCINDGTVLPEDLGAMSAEALCPAAFQKEKEEIANRSGQKVEEKVSALWACPDCKARSCTYREVQDRAADEPASIYCTCTVCSRNFKPH